jgi:hypothetical protein
VKASYLLPLLGQKWRYDGHVKRMGKGEYGGLQIKVQKGEGEGKNSRKRKNGMRIDT